MADNFKFNTPVVFLIYKRPQLAAKVFSVIQEVKPPILLVVADGAKPGDLEARETCDETRSIIDKVDWDCQLHLNYSDTNLGCAKRVSSGLDWAFSLVEEAIILEDDCIPDLSFFRFCQELLETYRDDQRVMVISGDNFQLGRQHTDYSYYFSRYNHCWGWATWRRAWRYFDYDMKLWPMVYEKGWLRDLLTNPAAVRRWTKTLQSTQSGQQDSWAYRWTFACWMQQGLTILPKCNLVSNIGFDVAGTHIKRQNLFANLPVESMDFPLEHPPFMIRDARADAFTEQLLFSTDFVDRVRRKLFHLLRSQR